MTKESLLTSKMSKKSNYLAFIPAKGNSSELKKKNLRKIYKKTLVEITLEEVKKTKIFNKILLSSDDEKILKIGKRKKIDTIKRPKNLSNSKASTESALLHAINKLNLSKFEGIFIFQVTSPLRNLNTIKSFYKFCKKKTIKNAITVSKTTALVSLNNENKKFKSLNDKEDGISRRQDKMGMVFENSLIYYIQTKFFINSKKIKNKNMYYYITDKYESIDIDNFKDLLVAKKLYKNFKK